MFLLWILIFKGLTARRLYKSFGVKGLSKLHTEDKQTSGAIAQNLVARDLYTPWDKLLTDRDSS
jgi:hypothetical protein